MGILKRLFGSKLSYTRAIHSIPVSYQADGMAALADPATPVLDGQLSALVLEAYRLSHNTEGLTADECANRIGRGILSVRPAVTKLYHANKLLRTGDKRPNLSGLQAHVLVAA